MTAIFTKSMASSSHKPGKRASYICSFFKNGFDLFANICLFHISFKILFTVYALFISIRNNVYQKFVYLEADRSIIVYPASRLEIKHTF